MIFFRGAQIAFLFSIPEAESRDPARNHCDVAAPVYTWGVNCVEPEDFVFLESGWEKESLLNYEADEPYCGSRAIQVRIYSQSDLRPRMVMGGKPQPPLKVKSNFFWSVPFMTIAATDLDEESV